MKKYEKNIFPHELEIGVLSPPKIWSEVAPDMPCVEGFSCTIKIAAYIPSLPISTAMTSSVLS